jgi:hypothetical protein
MMIILKYRVISFICAAMLASTAFADGSGGKTLKLGFGFDRDFGLVAALGDINAFIGNKGAAIDYLFYKEALKTDTPGPAHWYVGAGGYGDWDGDVGARLPIGAELFFAKKLDAFAEVIPSLRLDHDVRFGLDFAIGARYQF